MKIWIDFINTPQVSFFSLLIEELKAEGHHFLLTCRDSGNTVSLARQQGWDVKIIGDKAEKGFLKKMMAFPVRVMKLRKIVKKFQPDIAICQSSFYLPITSYLLKIPSIYTNDNEHALGNIPSFLFANKIFIPEYLPVEKAKKQGASPRKTTQYPGVKEGIYLWSKGIEINKERLNQNCNKIYLRPEPTTAQYYKGGSDFLDPLLESLQDQYEFIVLPRDKEQGEHYKSNRFRNIKVIDTPLTFKEIALNCKLFIGAGGSMTREMAIIGVPTISVYQDDLLGVDKYLVAQGLLKHEPNLTAEELLNYLNYSIVSTQANDILMEKGMHASQLFKEAILNFKK